MLLPGRCGGVAAYATAFPPIRSDGAGDGGLGADTNGSAQPPRYPFGVQRLSKRLVAASTGADHFRDRVGVRRAYRRDQASGASVSRRMRVGRRSATTSARVSSSTTDRRLARTATQTVRRFSAGPL